MKPLGPFLSKIGNYHAHYCPGCREMHADDGQVIPSVVCDGEGCGFHEFITLDGWRK